MSAIAVSMESLSGVRKAAILLITLGDSASAEIIRQLSEEEVQKVSVEVSRLESIQPADVQMVLAECHHKLETGELCARGGISYTKRMLVNAFGPEAARRLLDRVARNAGGGEGTLAALQKADPQQLASFIQNEHPQTIALVLSNLNTDQAGALLMSLPAELRPDVVARMASLDQTSPDIVEKIAKVVGQKLKSGRELDRAGGTRAVADMLNRLDMGSADEILAALAELHRPMADNIRTLMFVFEDVRTIDKEGMKALVSRIDRKVLTLALKGTSDEMKKHFSQCMSQRGAEMLREDMEALGSVRVRDVEAAQQQIIALVKQLQAEGSLSVKSSGGDQYVV
jgi:flagellar motor switch protein FliG